MPLNGAIYKKDATSATIVGGTDLTFTDSSEPIINGRRFLATALPVATRIAIVCKAIASKLISGKWSKEKRYIQVTMPKLESDGTYTQCVFRVETEIAASMTDAEKTGFFLLGIQTVTDSDASAFMLNGMLS